MMLQKIAIRGLVLSGFERLPFLTRSKPHVRERSRGLFLRVLTAGILLSYQADSAISVRAMLLSVNGN